MTRSILFASALAAALPGVAMAATYQVDFSVLGGLGVIGTFEAPLGGGPVSNLTVTLQGVTFDTQTSGGAFDYDPAQGDFVNYTGFPGFTNSVAAAACGAGACFLELYPLPGDPEPGDYLAIDADLNNIDDGTKYAILPLLPVPLPPAVAGLAAGLGALLMLRRRRT